MANDKWFLDSEPNTSLNYEEKGFSLLKPF